MIAGTIEPRGAIRAELKEAGFPLYALSNWSVETFQLAYPMVAFPRMILVL